MSDIFISYAHEDREIARQLAHSLESSGWNVWWDRTILAGETFDELIEKALDDARCVIAMWSTHSVASRWVRTEADEAARRNILVPVLIEQVKIPLAFRRIQSENMTGWDGTTEFRAFVKLKAAIEHLLGPAPADVEAERLAQEKAEREAEQQRRAAEKAKIEREAQTQRREDEYRQRPRAELGQPAAGEGTEGFEAAKEAAPEQPSDRTQQDGRKKPAAALWLVAAGLLILLAAGSWYAWDRYQLRLQSGEMQLATVSDELEKTRQTAAQLKQELETERAREAQRELEAQRTAAEAARKKEEERTAAEAARKKKEQQRKTSDAALEKEEAARVAAAASEPKMPETGQSAPGQTPALAAESIVASEKTKVDTAIAAKAAGVPGDTVAAEAGGDVTPTEEATEKKEPSRLAESPHDKPDSSTKPTLSLEPGTAFRDKLEDGSDGPTMVVVPNGNFLMGTNKGGPKEKPAHTVTFAKPFAIGVFEVTFADFDKFARATNRELPADKGWGRGKRPVIYVSWEDANAYAEWLTEQTGAIYRLPNEAEWEYAARAGSASNYWWGNRVGRKRANCNGCRSEWDGNQTAPVGSFKPNDFVVADTVGNVWEWVRDCWHENYVNAPADGSAWLSGKCGARVIRGGSWIDSPKMNRSTTRVNRKPGLADSVVGFRVCREL